MMPRSLAALIGLFVSVLVAATVFGLGLLLPDGIGKQIYFYFMAFPIVMLLTVIIVTLELRRRVRWTPNSRRDRALDEWSTLILYSIPFTLMLWFGIDQLRERSLLIAVPVICVLCYLYLIAAQIKTMRNH